MTGKASDSATTTDLQRAIDSVRHSDCSDWYWALVSPVMDPFKLAVGGSTSAFGLLGVWAAEIALSWHLMTDRTRARMKMWGGSGLAGMAAMTLICPQLDVAGHLGENSKPTINNFAS